MVLPFDVVTSVICWLSVFMPVTFWFLWISPPFCLIILATSSHIWPGPSFGYVKRFIKLVSVPFCETDSSFLKMLLMADRIAFEIESPLILCLPHSGLIFWQGTPHTFSV